MQDMANNSKKSIQYPENPKVKAQLIHGDPITIAAKTGHDFYYVHQVLRGERNSKKIIDAAKELIEMRKKFLAQ
jgi:hypothetical protein